MIAGSNNQRRVLRSYRLGKGVAVHVFQREAVRKLPGEFFMNVRLFAFRQLAVEPYQSQKRIDPHFWVQLNAVGIFCFLFLYW